MAKKQSFFNTIIKGSTATILLYGDVGDGRGVDSKSVVTELMTLTAAYANIDIHINSVGGDVFSGIAIYNALKSSSAHITIYVDGLAASIAGVIALCGKPLYMSKYAKLMLHNVSGGAWGNAKELRETATLIEDLEDNLASIIAGRLNMKPEQVRETYFDGKDHWFTAEEALAQGLIDGIFDSEEMDGLDEQSTTEEIYDKFNNRLQTQSQTNQKDMAFLDDIKTIPSFANVASEGEAVARIRQLDDQAGKVANLENVVRRQKEKIEELEGRELKAILDKAVSEKKITEAQRPTYEALLKSDRENTLTLLDSLAPARKKAMATDFTVPEGTPQDKFSGKSWAELDKAGLLAELKTTNKELFSALYKQEFGIDYKD